MMRLPILNSERESSTSRRAQLVRHTLVVSASMLLALAMTPSAWAQVIHADGFEAREGSGSTFALNDTGITWSGHATSGNADTCDPVHPAGQDCHYGRDAQAAAGTLQKVGASTPNNGVENGFDYTKISNSGNDLPADAQLGSGSDDWACTRDNVTGLIWEVKTEDSGLHYQYNGYSWYDTNSPDGFPGAESPQLNEHCHAPGRCDTEKFIEDINNSNLCNNSDWRMPSHKELLSIVDSGRYSPTIDPGYFPNTPSSYFWSASPVAGYSGYAWYVYFFHGYSFYNGPSVGYRVRAVRGGQ